MNIVFSTTRQWNPGDEIILLGCRQLLEQLGVDCNPLIFNRNPQIRHRGRWRRLWDRQPFLDNSVKNGMDLSGVDLVVFAGSPEWRGARLRPLYRAILKHQLPCVFLGIGSNRPIGFDRDHFSADEMEVFRNARLITCRDSWTTTALQPLGAHQISCPALLSSPHSSRRIALRRIGLIYGTSEATTGNHLSVETAIYLRSLYRDLLSRYGQRYQFEMVAHYIDELVPAAREWPELPLRYSYDSLDYLGIYGRYDLVIGPRVHGIGAAASQGVPGIHLSHDARGETTRGFGARAIKVGAGFDEVAALVDDAATGLAEHSQTLLQLRMDVLQQYRAVLEPVLRSLPGERRAG